MSASTRSVALSGWRRIPGPPRDRVKARLLRIHGALVRRFGSLERARRYRLEAQRSRAFTRWLSTRFRGRFAALRRAPLGVLRAELLRVPGLGREMVDGLLLHAANRPVFVADTAVRRVLARHRLIPAEARFEAVRLVLEAHLPSDPKLFRELHGGLHAVAETHCRQTPLCATCPLRADLRGRPPARV